MFTLVGPIRQINHNAGNGEILLKINSLDVSKFKSVYCKSVDKAFLQFTKQILENTTCTPVHLTLSIMNQNNKRFTKSVTRKKLKTPINSFKYIHFIKK